VRPQAWYLRSDAGDAGLRPEPPPNGEPADTYRYDPHDPVISLAGGGPFGMGMDQRPLEHRLLCYTSAPLERELALVGPLKAVLQAASDAPDTDWVVRLSWVRSDGAALILSGGILRARYRRCLWEADPLTPDEPTRFEIPMMPLSAVIPAGDRLRLSVTSSDFPAHDRNLNTGEAIDIAQKGRVATNTIYHDASRASHVVLPVLG
jgi:putative CocE/NonD family hydrolase